MEKRLSLVFISLVVTSISLSLVTANAFTKGMVNRRRSGYGENCSFSVKCDRAAWLSCQEGICDCFQPDKMFYSDEDRKCVSRTGERCRFAITQEGDDTVIYDVMGCDANANCNVEGICVCNDGFYENSNGTCTATLGYLQPCSSNAMCTTFQSLHCQDGECKCNESIALYSNTTLQCLGLAQQPCINLQCTQNAICSLENDTCNCQNNFHPNSEGHCVPKIQPLGNCSDDSQCYQIPGQEYSCLDGICNCNSTTSMYATGRISRFSGNRYNHEFHDFEGPELTQCVGLVDFPCVNRLCAHNAFCSYVYFAPPPPTAASPQFYNDGWNNPWQQQVIRRQVTVIKVDTTTVIPPMLDWPGSCKCRDGFVKSRSGACARPHNSVCSLTTDCIDGLICRNSKCQCPFNTQWGSYSTETGSAVCTSVIGGPCRNNSSLGCGRDAECRIFGQKDQNLHHSRAGHCVCRDGFGEDDAGRCIAGHGTACRSKADCDPVATLECIDQKCDCPGFSEYNKGSRKCVGLVGAKCDASVEENVCTANAHCNETEAEAQYKELLGSCTCDEGYEESQNYTCQLISNKALSKLMVFKYIHI